MRNFPWRLLGWGAVGAALALPKLTNAPWTTFDYLLAGAFLGGAGLVIELAVRSSKNMAYRAGVLTTLVAGVGLIWVNGAVGFLGSEDNPANLLFGAVLAVALLGSVVGGFRARGMALSMFAAAVVQFGIGAAALLLPLGSPGERGVFEAVGGTGLFVFLWLLAAGLFQRAAGDAARTLEAA